MKKLIIIIFLNLIFSVCYEYYLMLYLKGVAGDFEQKYALQYKNYILNATDTVCIVSYRNFNVSSIAYDVNKSNNEECIFGNEFILKINN